MQIGEEEWIPKPRYYSSGYYQYNCNNLRELQELKFENCLLKWGSKWSKKPPLSERGEVRKFRLIGLRPGLVRAVSGIIVSMSRYHNHHPNNIVVTGITDHTNNKLFSCGKNSWPQMIFNRCIIRWHQLRINLSISKYKIPQNIRVKVVFNFGDLMFLDTNNT